MVTNITFDDIVLSNANPSGTVSENIILTDVDINKGVGIDFYLEVTSLANAHYIYTINIYDDTDFLIKTYSIDNTDISMNMTDFKRNFIIRTGYLSDVNYQNHRIELTVRYENLSNEDATVTIGANIDTDKGYELLFPNTVVFTGNANYSNPLIIINDLLITDKSENVNIYLEAVTEPSPGSSFGFTVIDNNNNTIYNSYTVDIDSTFAEASVSVDCNELKTIVFYIKENTNPYNYELTCDIQKHSVLVPNGDPLLGTTYVGAGIRKTEQSVDFIYGPQDETFYEFLDIKCLISFSSVFFNGSIVELYFQDRLLKSFIVPSTDLPNEDVYVHETLTNITVKQGYLNLRFKDLISGDDGGYVYIDSVIIEDKAPIDPPIDPPIIENPEEVEVLAVNNTFNSESIVVFINYGYLDLYEDSIRFNLKVLRLNKEETVSYSNNITIPGTKNNNKLLGNPSFYNQKDEFNLSYQKIPCQISILSKVISCYLYILGVKENGDIDIIIIDESIDLFRKMSEESLNNMDLYKYGIHGTAPTSGFQTSPIFQWNFQELSSHRENIVTDSIYYDKGIISPPFIFGDINYGNYPTDISGINNFLEIHPVYLKSSYSAFLILLHFILCFETEERLLNDGELQNENSLNPDYPNYDDPYKSKKGYKFNFCDYNSVVNNNNDTINDIIEKATNVYIPCNEHLKATLSDSLPYWNAPDMRIDLAGNSSRHTKIEISDPIETSTFNQTITISGKLRKSKDQVHLALYVKIKDPDGNIIFSQSFKSEKGDNTGVSGSTTPDGDWWNLENNKYSPYDIPSGSYIEVTLEGQNYAPAKQAAQSANIKISFSIQPDENKAAFGDEINLIKSLPDVSILDVFKSYIKQSGFAYYINNKTFFLTSWNELLRYEDDKIMDVEFVSNPNINYSYGELSQNNLIQYLIPSHMSKDYVINSANKFNSGLSASIKSNNKTLNNESIFFDLNLSYTDNNYKAFSTFNTTLCDRLGYFNYINDPENNQPPSSITDGSLHEFNDYGLTMLYLKKDTNKTLVPRADFNFETSKGLLPLYTDYINNVSTPSLLMLLNLGADEMIKNNYKSVADKLLYPVVYETEIRITSTDFQNLTPFTKIKDFNTGAIFSILELNEINIVSSKAICKALLLKIN